MREQVGEQSNLDHKENVVLKDSVDFNYQESLPENFEFYGKLEAISIKTDFTCSIDNQKSPQ